MHTARRGIVAAPRPAAGERGTALVTALIMLTIMGFFLFGFQMINRNELGFAAYSRNSALSLGVAEAGVQEAIKRLNMFGAAPGSTCFVNSLTSGAACSGSTSTPNANTVAYQARLSSDAAIFPILSLASVNGAPRGVRIYMQAVYKTGFGNTIIGPQVTFQGDASPITGDTYADTSTVFADYGSKSPQPGAGATATNLTSPQVLSGTTIDAGNGANEHGPFTYECASNSASEVAPTPCPRKTDTNGNAVPVNWHPMTPLGMTSADFTALINQCHTGCGALGVTIVQATQSNIGVTYTPVSYTPSYWSFSGANSRVFLAVLSQPVCVTAGAVAVPSGGSCGPGGHYYGQTSSTMRYLDWGLVQDDLTRGSAQTFFQSPSCTAPCANAGYQNGIRYVPLLPAENVPGLACQQNVNPGTNVFDQVNTGDGISCSSPISTIDQTTVTFSGTKSSPQSLVIDNAGSGIVHINGSLNGSSTLNCSNTNFNNYNWGVIFATGDIDIAANTVFTGIIYTPGNVYTHGTVLLQGGIFSSNDPSTGTQVNQVDDLGTVNFCGGSSSQIVLNPQFFTFNVLTWQDRPLGEP